MAAAAAGGTLDDRMDGRAVGSGGVWLVALPCLLPVFTRCPYRSSLLHTGIPNLSAPWNSDCDSVATFMLTYESTMTSSMFSVVGSRTIAHHEGSCNNTRQVTAGASYPCRRLSHGAPCMVHDAFLLAQLNAFTYRRGSDRSCCPGGGLGAGLRNGAECDGAQPDGPLGTPGERGSECRCPGHGRARKRWTGRGGRSGEPRGGALLDVRRGVRAQRGYSGGLCGAEGGPPVPLPPSRSCGGAPAGAGAGAGGIASVEAAARSHLARGARSLAFGLGCREAPKLCYGSWRSSNFVGANCCNVELLREHSAEEGTDTTSVTKESPRWRVRQDGACCRWASCSFCHASTSPLLLLAANRSE
eukprot:356365-Chlamydomonas_euryale.AAC.1